jgi:predicted ATPase
MSAVNPDHALTPDPGHVSSDETFAALARVLQSETFATTPVLRRFLRFVVEQTLHGNRDELKEYAVGVAVFDRGDAFDPQIDTIVRVQARRLRARLADYYAGPGRGEEVVIELPKGSYAASFQRRPVRGPAPRANVIAIADAVSPVSSDRFRLPIRRVPLIGREHAIDSVRRLLSREDVRLVTLTGAGGSGKTSLAVEAARTADTDVGRVQFVALGAMTDVDAASIAIAHALGLRHTDGRLLLEALREHVRLAIDEPVLLVLDNVEQLPGIATVIAALLEASAALKVLVTSRKRLRLSGEFNYTVDPLPVPSANDRASVTALARNPAVALFIQRAAAIDPSFALRDDNRAAVADVCAQLDGLPLALELAAARIRVLTPAALSARMRSSLDLLTSGESDAPPRQQTLRRTLEWSHALLAPEEQRLFRRLAVFSGGFTIESVEAVCNTRRDLGVSVLDGLSSLVDTSLLVSMHQGAAEHRFTMLMTVREFALEQLERSGERDAIRHAHSAYGLVVAEEIAMRKSPAEVAEWLATCDAELDNFRAALGYLIECRKTEWALRLSSALYRFWEHREHLVEGKVWFDTVLALPGAGARTASRARALTYAAAFASNQGDHQTAYEQQLEALTICRELGDMKGVVGALNSLAASAQFRRDYTTALDWSMQTLEACEAIGDKHAIAAALSNVATIQFLLGRHSEARSLLRQASVTFAESGEHACSAWCSNHLGDIAAALGEHQEARRLYEGAVQTFREMGDAWGLARSACDLGHLACDEGDFVAAHALFVDAMSRFGRLQYKRGLASALEGFARLSLDMGEPDRATTLAGAAMALRQATGAVSRGHLDRQVERLREVAIDVCDSDRAERWRAGLRMTADEAVAYALRMDA